MHPIILVGLARDFATALRSEGFDVTQVDGYFEVRELLESRAFSCVVAERIIPLEGIEKKAIDGLQFAVWASQESPWTKVLLLDRGWTKNLVRDASKVRELVSELTNLSILRYPNTHEERKLAFRHLQKELANVELYLLPRVGEIVITSEDGEVQPYNSHDPEFREDLVDFLSHKARTLSDLFDGGPWLECRWQGVKSAEIVKRGQQSLLAIKGEREPPGWSQDLVDICFRRFGKRLR